MEEATHPEKKANTNDIIKKEDQDHKKEEKGIN